MKRVCILLAITFTILIFALQYNMAQSGIRDNNAENLSEDDVLWAEKSGTREAQYKAACKKFDENAQYFIGLQEYYASIDFQNILEEQILKADEVEIGGILYSVDFNDDFVKLCKKSNSDEVLYGNAEDEIAKYVGHCQQISISINKETGELDQISIDVTNKNESEMVYLIWSKEKASYVYGLSELSVENWVLIFYGVI